MKRQPVPISAAAPFEAGGEGSTKPPISAFKSESINVARLVMLAGLLLQLALRMGWVTPEQHAMVADPGLLSIGAEAILEVVSIFMAGAGFLIEMFRRNGGAQPSPVKPLL